MAGNGWTWLGLLEMAGKWLRMAGNDWKGWKGMEMAKNGLKWLEMA